MIGGDNVLPVARPDGFWMVENGRFRFVAFTPDPLAERGSERRPLPNNVIRLPQRREAGEARP